MLGVWLGSDCASRSFEYRFYKILHFKHDVMTTIHYRSLFILDDKISNIVPYFHATQILGKTYIRSISSFLDVKKLELYTKPKLKRLNAYFPKDFEY